MEVMIGEHAFPGRLQLILGIFSLISATRAGMTFVLFPEVSSLTGDNQLYRSDIKGLELSGNAT